MRDVSRIHYQADFGTISVFINCYKIYFYWDNIGRHQCLAWENIIWYICIYKPEIDALIKIMLEDNIALHEERWFALFGYTYQKQLIHLLGWEFSYVQGYVHYCSSSFFQLLYANQFFLNTTVFFLLSGFSFRNIHDSQDSRGRGTVFLWLLSTTSTHFTDT